MFSLIRVGFCRNICLLINSSFFLSSFILLSIKISKLFDVGLDIDVRFFINYTLLGFVSVIYSLVGLFSFLFYWLILSLLLNSGNISGISMLHGCSGNYSIASPIKVDYSNFNVTIAIMFINIAWWFNKSITNIRILL